MQKIVTKGEIIKLTEADVNTSVVVVQLSTPDDLLKRKLQDLGFFRGIVIKVLSGNRGMPLLLAIGDGRTALSRDLAAFVKVKLIA